MTSRAQELLREALRLPAAERADVAAELLASLDDAEAQDPSEVEAAWAREIERRARRVSSGESTGEPWEDVRERVIRLISLLARFRSTDFHFTSSISRGTVLFGCWHSRTIAAHLVTGSLESFARLGPITLRRVTCD